MHSHTYTSSNIWGQEGVIKLVKNESKEIYNVTKVFKYSSQDLKWIKKVKSKLSEKTKFMYNFERFWSTLNVDDCIYWTFILSIHQMKNRNSFCKNIKLTIVVKHDISKKCFLSVKSSYQNDFWRIFFKGILFFSHFFLEI